MNAHLEISLTNKMETSMANLLVNAYRVGYSEIMVSFENPHMAKTIISIARDNLPNLEIIASSTGTFLFKYKKNENFDSAMTGYFSAIDSLFNCFYNRELNLDFLEKKVQVKDNLCRRLSSELAFPISQLSFSFCTELCHAQKEIYFALKENKGAYTRDTQILAGESGELYRFLRESFYSRNIANLESIHNLHKKILDERGYPLLQTCPSNERAFIYHIIHAIRNISMATSPLMGIFMHDGKINKINCGL